jgi:hypothetical protein
MSIDYSQEWAYEPYPIFDTPSSQSDYAKPDATLRVPKSNKLIPQCNHHQKNIL